eukprot:Protomagalhaensia_sp_Gyna_25__5270@NODE_64_length_5726_cov_52_732724_g47_i0_p2_GENE_NODE_64_length_5726_cov_52_732724_g47_i0NODE_64_length_5726_cov_52_732724_g47_i0_p2_ORF_typecomplete_len465_score76_21Peptidase_M20/PF01546_28/8_5e47M20_dimer/PF07687_14/1_8e03M20_dimer/PF07687_14/1_3e12_NODE_64_length_5726_cov_52_732724_g47_i032614655
MRVPLSALLITASLAAPPPYIPQITDLLEVGETLGLPKMLTKMRRSLHAEPEIGLSLPKTAKKVESFVESLLIDDDRVSTGWAINKTEGRGYGVVVDIGTGKEPCVIVRADMDALPIFEETDVPWKSTHPGAMHACGHDAHTSILCGALTFLRAQEGRMKGTIRLVFQPGEERPRGMKLMIEEGLLEKSPRPSRAIGLHVHPGFPTGSIVALPGDAIAAGGFFEVLVQGRGGHAGIPAMTRDPVVASAAIVSAFQTLTSRETLGGGPRSPGLLSVTHVNSYGQADNVIPDEVQMRGTVRGPSMEVVRFMQQRMVQVAENIAAAHRCNATVSFNTMMPSVKNDYDIIEKELAPLLADPKTSRINMEPGQFYYIMEDFAFLSQEIPSAFFFLGTHDPEMTPATSFPLHSPLFNLDESAMYKGSAFLATAALNLLEVLSHDGQDPTPPVKPDLKLHTPVMKQKAAEL